MEVNDAGKRVGEMLLTGATGSPVFRLDVSWLELYQIDEGGQCLLTQRSY